jgi:hypothetical protein
VPVAAAAGVDDEGGAGIDYRHLIYRYGRVWWRMVPLAEVGRYHTLTSFLLEPEDGVRTVALFDPLPGQRPTWANYPVVHFEF